MGEIAVGLWMGQVSQTEYLPLGSQHWIRSPLRKHSNFLFVCLFLTLIYIYIYFMPNLPRLCLYAGIILISHFTVALTHFLNLFSLPSSVFFRDYCKYTKMRKMRIFFPCN